MKFPCEKDESLENVIHGASVGAGEDEPDIVARVVIEATPPAEIAGANAADGAEPDGSGEEERRERERLRELWLSLLEREQRQLRLQELEGLRAQEATVRELKGRVAAAAEERLLQLRVDTLQEENGSGRRWKSWAPLPPS